jgi:hypothetical protein
MNTDISRDPCENEMFTNSNKAFINFNYFEKGFLVSQLSIANRQERDSEKIIYLLSSEEATSKQEELQ